MLKSSSHIEGVYGASISGSGSTIIAFGQEQGLLDLSHKWEDIWKRKAIEGEMLLLDVSEVGVEVEN